MQMHGLAGMTWLLAAGLIGIVGDVTSIRRVLMALAFGLAAPLLLMLQGRHSALATQRAR